MPFVSDVSKKEFFQNILRNFESDNSIEVKKVEKNKAGNGADNFTSNVFKIKVSGYRINTENKKIEYKKCLISKEIPKIVTSESINSKVAHQNEIVAYKKIIPALNKYLKNHINVPDCIFANDEVIILEDLTFLGFKSIDKKYGFSLEKIHTVLKEIAKIHGASILWSQKDPESFQNTKNQIEETIITEKNKLLHTQKLEIEVLVKIFKTKENNIEILQFLDNLLEKDHIALQIDILKQKSEVMVFNHGDLWANNILFNQKNDLKLIDLQIMRSASIAIDLVYFLFINVEPKVLKENLDNFLNTYLENFNSITKPSGVTINFDWLNNEFKRCFVIGFLFSLWIMPIFYYDFKKLVELNEKSKTGVELYLLELVPEHVQRMVDLTIFFVENVE